MAFQARKVSGAFEKRAPELQNNYGPRKIFVEFRGFRVVSFFERLISKTLSLKVSIPLFVLYLASERI